MHPSPSGFPFLGCLHTHTHTLTHTHPATHSHTHTRVWDTSAGCPAALQPWQHPPSKHTHMHIKTHVHACTHGCTPVRNPCANTHTHTCVRYFCRLPSCSSAMTARASAACTWRASSACTSIAAVYTVSVYISLPLCACVCLVDCACIVHTHIRILICVPYMHTHIRVCVPLPNYCSPCPWMSWVLDQLPSGKSPPPPTPPPSCQSSISPHSHTNTSASCRRFLISTHLFPHLSHTSMAASRPVFKPPSPLLCVCSAHTHAQ